jgi:hypothetical protein
MLKKPDTKLPETKLLESRQLLEIKLYNLLSLKLYLNNEQKHVFDAILEKAREIDESRIEEFIANQVDVLIDIAKQQKRGFLNNNF